MKKLIIILSLMAASLITTAQTVEVGVCQDARLAFFVDGTGTLTPPTLAVIIQADVSHHDLHASIGYERVQLESPYNRVALGVGFSKSLYNFEVRENFNVGYIIREWGKFFSYSSETSFAYNLKRVSPFVMGQFTRRKEWGDMIRFSGFFGIRVKLVKPSTKYQKQK